MKLLVIDTSTGTSVAVVDGGVVVVERTVTETRSHAEVVGRLLAEVLAESGSTIDGVVAGLGPGPFTGLRVGIAAAISFAAAREIPVFGVPSHNVGILSPTPVTIVTDARRKEWAWSSYEDGAAIAGPSLVPTTELGSLAVLATHPERRCDTVSAGELGLAATIQLDRGDDLSDLTPLYLRAPDATPSNGPKRVSQ
jgi:tRNA threonylcarbamoyl adenosine modification protein YeaZ